MIKTVYIFIFLVTFSFSESLEEIKSLQKSLAKDFIIYLTLKNGDISSDEAKELLVQIYRLNPKLEYEFHQKIKDKEFNFAYECKKMKKDKFISSSDECLLLAITPAKVQTLSKDEQNTIYKRLEKLHKKKIAWLSSMLEDDVFSSLTKGDGVDFLRVFFSVDEQYKKDFLDKRLPKEFLYKLVKQRGFERFVVYLALNNKYQNLTTSLLKQDFENLSFKSNFYLGMLAVLRKENALSLKFFHLAYKSTQKLNLQDKALFWMYEISKSRKILQQLSNSSDFNIYATYAKELLNKDYEVVTPKPTKKSLKNYSITDPFTWEATKKHIENFSKPELDKFSKKFFTKATLPYYVFMRQRITGYKKHYFIAPYAEFVKNSNPKRKTLLYAIARQESRCIPVDVSTSYALGMMQFMPFLARATAEQVGFKDFIYEDMFKPKVALEFANIHLDYLEKYLYNPLLVAYAYNGGIGFTRRMLNERFKNGLHEPFLSMELVKYEQSREYGKKVLANYTQYAKIFGYKASLREIFQNLKQPSLSYEFAK